MSVTPYFDPSNPGLSGEMGELAHSNLHKTKTDDLKSSALQNWRSEADLNIKPKRLVITDGVPLSPLGGAE